MSTHRPNAGFIEQKSSSSCFQWYITNFCMNCNGKVVGWYLESPEFITNSFSTTMKWKLRLFPGGQTEETVDYVGLHLCSNNRSNMNVDVTLSLLNSNEQKVVSNNISKFFQAGEKWEIERYVQKKFIICDKNQVLVESNNELRILCEIRCFDLQYAFKYFFGQVNKGKATNVKDQLACRVKEFDDFEILLENGNFTDITIVVGDRQFNVHKAIITSRSAVFEAMLKHEMKEKKENVIGIMDIKPEVMKEVLRFMYAGKVNDIKTMTNDLLIAAEKYSIGGLKNLCVQTMCKNLKIENALEFLKLADMCNANDLKSKVIHFIVSNQKAVTENPEFKVFTQLHPEIQIQLIRAIVAENVTK